MLRIAPGSKEWLSCKVQDVLPSPDAITTLVGRSPTFEVQSTDETVIMTGVSASIASGDPLIALCLIDATIGTPAPKFPAEGEYHLFLTFNNTPEVPRLGPFPFLIDD